jgi:hypothetical protein
MDECKAFRFRTRGSKSWEIIRGQGPGLVTSLVFFSKNGKMDIMDPQWPSRKAERLSGSGHGRLNSYSPGRQTRVSPCACERGTHLWRLAAFRAAVVSA